MSVITNWFFFFFFLSPQKLLFVWLNFYRLVRSRLVRMPVSAKQLLAPGGIPMLDNTNRNRNIMTYSDAFSKYVSSKTTTIYVTILYFVFLPPPPKKKKKKKTKKKKSGTELTASVLTVLTVFCCIVVRCLKRRTSSKICTFWPVSSN